MKVIEQNHYHNMRITKTLSDRICVDQVDVDGLPNQIYIEKDAAKQLIKILEDYVK